MGDTDCYKGIGGWLALHYWLFRSNNHRRKEKLCYRIASRLPLTIKLYVIADAAGKVSSGGIIEPDKITYTDMYASLTEGKVL